MIADPRGWLPYIAKDLGRVSPLYAHLYQEIERDANLGELLSLIDPDQPLPVLFFSVVSFVLLAHPQHELAAFYPVLTSRARPASEAVPAFRSFCREYREELRALLPGARLQTNEVTRCANLLPAFELIARRTKRRPLALIEIGCSAGLNLRWDRYGYHYGRTTAGDLTSPVQLHCTLHEDVMPPLPLAMPPIAQRIGIDLSPLDPSRERDVRWLRSCIWPEELERYQLLEAALNLAPTIPCQILAGDAVEILPDLLAQVPEEQTLCLWHSYALRQGPAQVRSRLEALLLQASQTRPLFRLSLEVEPMQGGWPRLELFTYREGRVARWEWLATCDFHGQAMRWLAPWV